MRLLWTQKQDVGPAARGSARLVYDTVRERVVLFGGELMPLRTGDASRAGDTWEWDGESWTQVADIGPPARRRHAMAYDDDRQRIVLFGGGGEGDRDLGDTWEWDGEFWTQIADTGPSPRKHHAMVYDKAQKRVVLFGGLGKTMSGDTWEWDGDDWTQQDDTGPAPRHSHAMAYDVMRQAVVLFGGSGVAPDSGDLTLGDTYERKGGVWTREATFGPGPTTGGTMSYGGRSVILFGGWMTEGAKPGLSGGTWEWDGKHWKQRQDIGPAPRAQPGMAYDSKRNCVVLFGGEGEIGIGMISPFVGDTWELYERPSNLQ